CETFHLRRLPGRGNQHHKILSGTVNDMTNISATFCGAAELTAAPATRWTLVVRRYRKTLRPVGGSCSKLAP
ncbi:MAG: hypothetical protein E6614_33115, partial [Bradyrhizobium sp.]|nr:hypothetical protein [Bradyrhizobium sp.]